MNDAHNLITRIVKAFDQARGEDGDTTINPLAFFANPALSNWLPEAKKYLEENKIPRYAGVEQFEYDLGLTQPVICLMEYEEGETGSRERGTGLQLEPDYPASATLIGAYLNGVDILDILFKETIDSIETAYLETY